MKKVWDERAVMATADLPMVGKTKTQNAADKRRFEAMSEIGCIPCMIGGWDGVPATTQHVTEAGRRLNDEHQQTYRSCQWHHLGKFDDPVRSIRAATKIYGPSFERNKRAFAERYGTERQLIQIQDALVRMYFRAHEKGEYLPAPELTRLTNGLYREIVLDRPPSMGW